MRDLDLDEPVGPDRGRAPVVDEPDEPLDGGRQIDLDLGDRRHRRRQPRRAEAGHEPAHLELVDRVLGQIEHRVAEPRIRARVPLLGDEDG